MCSDILSRKKLLCGSFLSKRPLSPFAFWVVDHGSSTVLYWLFWKDLKEIFCVRKKASVSGCFSSWAWVDYRPENTSLAPGELFDLCLWSRGSSFPTCMVTFLFLWLTIPAANLIARRCQCTGTSQNASQFKWIWQHRRVLRWNFSNV